LEDIENFLTLEQQQKHQAIMLLPKSEWFSMEDTLSNDEIISLIQFFTLAEMKYNEWSAEEKSPVIWLNKLLRKKGSALDKELLLWIKSHSTNKFIPHIHPFVFSKQLKDICYYIQSNTFYHY